MKILRTGASLPQPLIDGQRRRDAQPCRPNDTDKFEAAATMARRVIGQAVAGQGDETLTISRSLVYQFESIVREPRLHRRDEDNLKGTLEKDVRLAVPSGQGSIPHLPDLVPVVRFK